jgi:hypothetical protein
MDRTKNAFSLKHKEREIQLAFIRAGRYCKLKWDMKDPTPNPRRDIYCITLPLNNATSAAMKGSPDFCRLEQVNQYSCNVVFPNKLISYAAHLLGYTSSELCDIFLSLHYHYK